MRRGGGCAATDNMNNLQNIKVLAIDVDGVLTDGTISFDPSTNQEIKSFHVHDGLGISLWKKAGNEVILISGRNSEAVSKRSDELGIQYVFQGSRDKIADLECALNKIGATPKQTAFIGDDLGDIPIMQHVGYAIAVNNAVDEIKNIANWVSTRIGGHGAVRDSIEHIMKNAGTWKFFSTTNHVESVHQELSQDAKMEK